MPKGIDGVKLVIYGAGHYGRIVKNYYVSKGYQVSCFIETNKTKDSFEGLSVKDISDLKISDDDFKIFVAMDEKNWDSVKKSLADRFSDFDKNNIRYISSSEIKMYEREINPIRSDCFLECTFPVDNNFGVGRGTPIDRYYIEKFLKEQSSVIEKSNDTLEVGEDTYSRKYFPNANHNILNHMLGMDLTIPGTIPDEKYDVFICTQTLHQIYEVEKAIAGCYSLLKQGGTLLATVCGTITKLAHTDEYEHYWGFTELSIKNLMKQYFKEIKVESYGNVMAATAFIQGIAVEEVDVSLLEMHDRDYPICISVVAKK